MRKENTMQVNDALAKLKEVLNKEKNQIEYMIKGAELLVTLIKQQENNSNERRDPIKRSEPELEKAAK